MMMFPRGSAAVRALWLVLRHVAPHDSPLDVRPVDPLRRVQGVVEPRERDEREPSRLPRLHVVGDLHALDVAVALAQIPQRALVRVEREAAQEDRGLSVRAGVAPGGSSRAVAVAIIATPGWGSAPRSRHGL